MRSVSGQTFSYIPWTVVLFGAINGEAFLWGFAKAAPRPRLRLLALGVTSSPPRRPKSAWRAQPCISRSASPTIICRSNFSLQFPLWNIPYRSRIYGWPWESQKDQVFLYHDFWSLGIDVQSVTITYIPTSSPSLPALASPFF